MNTKETKFILWFNELGIEDVPFVGGKNASLGEMYRLLTPKGVNIPNGFAVTAYAYHYLLEKAGIKQKLKDLLKGLDTHNMRDLADRGHKVREVIRSAEFPPELREDIIQSYAQLCKMYGPRTDVAVRSSATAEDLPDASFAGQQETYLNIKGDHELINACKNCFASLFTNRAISYRVDRGFDHFSIGLSIGVQKMVRSDKACSGVMFSIDTETGFKDAVFVTGAYGLGETVVQGAVNPDEYYVFKPTLKQGYKAILSKKLGEKKIKMIYNENGAKGTTRTVEVKVPDRKKFVLTDDEILIMAKWACIVEDHYSKKAGKFKPMDMEWAKDGVMNKLFIVQARPETVHSQKDLTKLREYKLLQKGKVVVEGKAVGELVGQGQAAIIRDAKEISHFKKGQVLITEMTDPDWEPIMKIASAIVTERGGRTCFGAGTKILTNEGFRNIEEMYEDYEGLSVPSLNRTTGKIEWKPIVAAMKRDAPVIEIESSLTGRMSGNTLKLTPDHKMITIDDAQFVDKQINDLLKEGQMLLCAQKIPGLTEATQKQKELAYLLGAISTDGHIYTARTHGEVQFIQKETEEKAAFIAHVSDCLEQSYNKSFKKSIKNTSSGEIRGKPVIGNANAYRCYSKNIAYALLEEQKTVTQTLLQADVSVVLSFLAGVIDGDGSYNKEARRVNIYCSKQYLLEAIVVSCLRIGIVPQISTNRTIWNVQIVEQLDELFKWTKRVKGETTRKRQGTRFFAARQMLQKSGYVGQFSAPLEKNLYVDAEKVRASLHTFSEEYQEKIKVILASETRMQRVSLKKECGMQEVYNITVADNHNYIVFTERFTPVLVNNCHAAIISRELGVPCVVGTNNATEKIKNGQKVTVDCSTGEKGIVYDGLLKFKIEETDLKSVPKTKTKIMMNLAAPEQAFEKSFLPNDGVGLARQEFIINSYIKVHPKALIHFKELKDEKLKAEIEEMTHGYADKKQYFVDKLAQGIATIGAAFYPKDVIVRMSDFKSNEYANLVGGHLFEPHEENPMIGWRGASRYYSPEYREAFELECQAMKKVREEIGLTNIKVMIPFCRTVEEGKKVLDVMKKQGLVQGKNGLQVYAMCEIPANVILAEEFLTIFDGFSIGSNDLTQLTLGVDRDSALVAHVYNESNEAVKLLVQRVVSVANKMGKHMGFCGQAPSDNLEFAKFLVECGIEAMSLNPDSVVKTTLAVAELEKKLHR